MTGDQAQIRQALEGADAVLFDFDGPLCDVFAGLPAPTVARALEELAGRTYRTDDPLEVLRLSAQQGDAIVRAVEEALVRAELEAVARSVSNRDGLAALQACLDVGLRVGIVSNNSGPAVTLFLEAAHLAADVRPIIGREPGRPELMKPNPWPLRRALDELGCAPDRVVFVGDSMTDIEVAAIVDVSCVAYANKPTKRARFAGTGALVIDNMSELAVAVKLSHHRG